MRKKKYTVQIWSSRIKYVVLDSFTVGNIFETFRIFSLVLRDLGHLGTIIKNNKFSDCWELVDFEYCGECMDCW